MNPKPLVALTIEHAKTVAEVMQRRREMFEEDPSYRKNGRPVLLSVRSRTIRIEKCDPCHIRFTRVQAICLVDWFAIAIQCLGHKLQDEGISGESIFSVTGQYETDGLDVEVAMDSPEFITIAIEPQDVVHDFGIGSACRLISQIVAEASIQPEECSDLTWDLAQPFGEKLNGNV